MAPSRATLASPTPQQIGAFLEMITISHTTLRAAPEPCQGKNMLFFYFMNEQACMLSINVCINHWGAFPLGTGNPSQAAKVASSPRERPRDCSLHFFWTLGSCLVTGSLTP